MKRVVTMALLLAVSGLAMGRGSTTTSPVPCTVGTNHKCVYPEATLKDRHLYQRLQRFLRKRGK